MSAVLRTSLFVISAIALAGCGESFVASSSGGTTSNTSASAGNGGTGAGGDGAAAGAGSGGASAGSGGAGGAPCDPVDHDGDGLSQCDGDCDDANPQVRPGAIEICGDGVDGNCDGADDLAPPCDGLG